MHGPHILNWKYYQENAKSFEVSAFQECRNLDVDKNCRFLSGPQATPAPKSIFFRNGNKNEDKYLGYIWKEKLTIQSRKYSCYERDIGSFYDVLKFSKFYPSMEVEEMDWNFNKKKSNKCSFEAFWGGKRKAPIERRKSGFMG